MQVIVAGSSNTSNAQDQGTSCSVTCSEMHAAGSCAEQVTLRGHLVAPSVQLTRSLKMRSGQILPPRQDCMPAHASRTSGHDTTAVKLKRRSQGPAPSLHGLSPQ